mmetsp:Transcript_55151/g.98200  ORF Transcript_55151/g.98200 Transcript_55151/m.98200 type:complete len:101 (-) Transcript_55151:262-564(-)
MFPILTPKDNWKISQRQTTALWNMQRTIFFLRCIPQHVSSSPTCYTRTHARTHAHAAFNMHMHTYISNKERVKEYRYMADFPRARAKKSKPYGTLLVFGQ